MARQAIASLESLARVADETSSWPYHHDRDLTGFIDGSENPTLVEAPDVAVLEEPNRGAGGSVLLLQKWSHAAASWEAQPVARQEQVIGRTKPASIELEPRPPDSHVARTDQERYGKIFRRNMRHGTVNDHGTMFVDFSADQRRLVAMHERYGWHSGCSHFFRNAHHRLVLLRPVATGPGAAVDRRGVDTPVARYRRPEPTG